MRHNLQSTVSKFIRDKNGKLVLMQLPNLPLLVFFGASLLTRLFDGGTTGYIFRVIAFGSIFTWAWWELFDGVNYFRRGLGLVVLVLSIMSAVVVLQ